MHPIVIIASDKDPAIGAAVDGLQAAGFEVRVLNSATAKLVDFLGALAGVDDDDEPKDEPAEDEPKEPKAKEPPAEEAPEEAPPEEEDDENDPLNPKRMEALIAGEPVTVEIVDGAEITLHPSSISAGARTSYTLNEAQFAFWPSAVSNEPITGGVDLSLNGETTNHLTRVIFSEEAMNPPVLKIGREWLKEARYPEGWALLPATKILYGKSKVGVEDVRKEMGDGGVILVCSQYDRMSGNTKFPVLLTSYGSMAKPGTSSMAHHDQNFRNLGEFTIVGNIHLGKTAEDDRVEYMDGAEGKFDPKTVMGPVFVFK